MLACVDDATWYLLLRECEWVCGVGVMLLMVVVRRRHSMTSARMSGKDRRKGRLRSLAVRVSEDPCSL